MKPRALFEFAFVSFVLISWFNQCDCQPIVVASSFTDITVNGSYNQLIVRYDPDSNSVIGHRCTSSGCEGSFTIKSSVTLASLSVAAESSFKYYNTTSYWVAGSLIVDNNYGDPYLWIYQCLNFYCTAHSERRYSTNTIYGTLSKYYFEYTGYYTNILLYPSDAQIPPQSYSYCYPIIVWVGMPNVVAILQCTDLQCQDYFNHISYIVTKSQYGNVSNYDFFVSEDPYVPVKWTGVPWTSNYQYAQCAVWPEYNTTTSSFSITGPYISCKYCTNIACLDILARNIFFLVVFFLFVSLFFLLLLLQRMVPCMVVVTHLLIQTLVNMV